MKRSYLSLLFLIVTTTAFAQLKVFSDGKTSISCQNEVSQSLVTAGDGSTYSYSSGYRFGLYSSSNTGYYSIGAKGSAWTVSDRSIGLQGLAGCTYSSGRSFGVIGGLNDTNSYGAGIFGTTTNHVGSVFTGRYAGYFDGDVYICGTTTISNLVTPSDMRLKENVIPLNECDRNETLSKILAMNVIKYNYNNHIQEDPDTTTNKEASVQKPETHYGLYAQELIELYPDLVTKGQDGYYGVKYLELVPILIRSIQELKQELDEVKGESNARITRSESNNKQDISSTSSSTNILYQNLTNPLKEQTIIRFKLASNTQNASICFFDMKGKLLKKLPISSGMESVSIGGYELGEGMFLYSLIVNGQEVDTKRMIITK